MIADDWRLMIGASSKFQLLQVFEDSKSRRVGAKFSTILSLLVTEPCQGHAKLEETGVPGVNN